MREKTSKVHRKELLSIARKQKARRTNKAAKVQEAGEIRQLLSPEYKEALKAKVEKRLVRNRGTQFNEEEKLAAIIQALGLKEGWCVDVGASDGIFFSNTLTLLKDKGWNGILIEPNVRKHRILEVLHEETKGIALHTLVKLEGENSLDNILCDTDCPDDFDLLDIDIDGDDYWVWDSLENYHPKIIIIEFNPYVPDDLAFINPKGGCGGSSVLAFNQLAERKGYELVDSTPVNLIYVRKDLSHKIGKRIIPHRISDKYRFQTFFLYDGTIAIVLPPKEEIEKDFVLSYIRKRCFKKNKRKAVIFYREGKNSLVKISKEDMEKIVRNKIELV